MTDDRLEAPTTVRWTSEQAKAIQRLASDLGGSAGTAARYLLNLGLRWIASERPVESADSVTGVPLAAGGVGAGAGQLELIPEGVHPYFFRRTFLERKGWSALAPDRFAIYKLGTDEVASSMDPTIAPESVVLVDREADRDAVEPRSIWIVRDAGGLILKRVTVDDGWIVLESDNRHPEFAPRVLHVTKKERHQTLVGRVLWHAAELA
jgi:phage repressor protein C with HTH and peptisase S24 domain